MKRFYSFGLFAIVLLCGCATTRVVPPLLYENTHSLLKNSHRYGDNIDSISAYTFQRIITNNGSVRTKITTTQQAFNKWGYLTYEESRVTIQTNDKKNVSLHNWDINTYNDLGQIVRKEEYSSEQGLDYSVDYTYNKRGLVETIVKTYHPNCVPTTTKYFYDRHNNNIRKEFYQADSLISWDIYKYNKQGLLLEETHLRGADKATTYSISHIYDRHNRKVKTTTLSHFSSVIKIPCVPIVEDYKNSHLNKETWGKVKDPINPIKLDTLIECYSYTNTGKLSEVQSWCSSLGAEWYTSEKREYHDNGNVAKKITWNRCTTKDGIRPMQVEIYNKQGLVIEKQYYSNDLKALRTVVRTEYNDQGKVTAQMEYDWKGKLKETTHTIYNSDGKKIEKWSFKHNGTVVAHEEHTYLGDVWVESKIYYDDTRLQQHSFKTTDGNKTINYDKTGNIKSNSIVIETPDLEWFRSYEGAEQDILIREIRMEIFRRQE